MNFKVRILSSLILLALATTGCDRLAGGPAGQALVVDLGAVAKATGQDVEMEQQMEVARQDLAEQLNKMAADLEAGLKEEQEKLGAAPSAEQQQQLQQKVAEAQQQYAQTQGQAQQRVQQYQANLVLDYRDSLQPVVQKIASARGSTMVMVVDSSLLWTDPTVDLTGEVIAALRAKAQTDEVSEPAATEAASADAASDAAPETEPEPEPELGFNAGGEEE
jgi:Skp family chaperone for outer membrane proteins